MESVYETLHVVRGSKRYNKWLYSQIAHYIDGVVLDIGSGLGDIARQFHGWGPDTVSQNLGKPRKT